MLRHDLQRDEPARPSGGRRGERPDRRRPFSGGRSVNHHAVQAVLFRNTMRPALTVLLCLIPLLVSGCLNGSSALSPAQFTRKGTIEGRVFTTACGGPAASSCVTANYRGSLVFCKTMNQIGLCPSAHVDRRGHYEIRLTPGRYAL